MDERGRAICLADETLIAISSPNNGAMEAVVSGRLSIDDSVLTLDWGTDSHAWPAVLLPHDTEVLTENPLTLFVLGRTLRIGDAVYGGGGGVGQDSPLAPQELPVEFAGRGLVALQTIDQPV